MKKILIVDDHPIVRDGLKQILADTEDMVVGGEAGSADEALALVRDADWDRLAGTVDQIVHSAALVNHVLPYAQLFEPNVVGTAELIRLALTTRSSPSSTNSPSGPC